MSIASKREPFMLFLGDIVVFVAALWLTLFFRYAEVPSEVLFFAHLNPFLIIFAVWFLVFFIFGFYDKHTLMLKSRISDLIGHVLAINGGIAVLFFYLAPMFAITPKTNLFIDLVITFVLLVFWRVVLFPRLDFGRKQKALLVGQGEEMKLLRDEVNNNPRYKLYFVSTVDLDEIDGIDFKDEVLDTIYSEEISTIVVDLRNDKVRSVLPHFYNLIYSKVHFVDMYKVYEDIFERVPLTALNYNWFIENISSSSHVVYSTLKRIVDICVATVLGIVALCIFPFVYIAIKLDDGGPMFIRQQRIGQRKQPIYLYKVRSMTVNDGGVWVKKDDNRITRVGGFLRKTRIDELPQLWNVLRGDISLIGPRPDIHDLGEKLSKELPYYNIRNLVKPGLSGWAQVKQVKPPQSIDETRIRLEYDLYYIKNRSLLLDMRIALQTLQILILRVGM